MSFQQDSAELLAALGRRYGIEGLAFNGPSGHCVLGFDRRITVWLAADAAEQGLAMFATLGSLTLEARPDLMLAMLSGNFDRHTTGGATLAFDRTAGVAVLTQILPLAGLDAERLEARLNTFVDRAIEWAGILAQPVSASARTTAAEFQLLA